MFMLRMADDISGHCQPYLLSNVAAIGRLANGVGGDGDIHTVEDCGLVTPGLQSSPSRHCGHLSSKILTSECVCIEY